MKQAAKICAIALAAGLTVTGCAYESSGHGYDRGYQGDGYPGRDHQGGGYQGESRGHHDGEYDRDYRGGNGYHGNHGYGERRDNPFRVSQRDRLDPWLAHTPEGHKFIRDHYRVGRDNVLSRSDANDANAFFRSWADVDRDYRLSDIEIRTALDHTANNYGRSRPRW